MTIENCRGDLLRAGADALVNTVNCVGVMGAGLALQFKRAYPDCFYAYAQLCKGGAIKPGHVHVWVKPQELWDTSPVRYVINFPTKRHWREPSHMEDIDAGLAALVAAVTRHGIKSIAIPALGCNLGGLDWDDVRPRIEAAFASLPDVRVLLYEPC